MTLMQAFSEHLVAGQQGQLVIKFTGDVHLCKILVEDGCAVHISHGRVSPEEILGTLGSKTVEWVNFIAGYPVRKKLDFPLHDNLLAAVGQQAAPAPQPVAAPQPAAPVAPEPAPAVPDGPTVEADKVVAAIDGFIDRVGPLGTILADQAAAAANYTSGTPMPESSYSSFIQALAAEVPDDDRAAFVEQFKL
jgi:hypothetical protein